MAWMKETAIWQDKCMQAKLLEDSQSKDLIEARPQDGFGTSGQPDGALISWPYAPKNSFFYDQPAVPYTDRELADQVQVCLNSSKCALSVDQGPVGFHKKNRYTDRLFESNCHATFTVRLTLVLWTCFLICYKVISQNSVSWSVVAPQWSSQSLHQHRKCNSSWWSTTSASALGRLPTIYRMLCTVLHILLPDREFFREVVFISTSYIFLLSPGGIQLHLE